ncbi:constitutive expressor of pathogenesis related genes 5 [Striga asiatica]|uniref:Constitutive expressor of pathogenesis related genes 5 n=1 Tax=Striga asiatica TaxID=4170 RepID=A0A5A7QRT4_STRAF|nr:constitutive expressor of pathogenesis related genes 5 [Striga asiatica]
MATFNTGLHLLKCQIQVLSRMLFGILMIGAIAFLLLGVMCGYAGKFCVDTLGGSGSHWLIYWEALCLLHFLSNVFSPYLYVILNGPITVVERAEGKSPVLFPYWVRRVIVFASSVANFAFILWATAVCGPTGVVRAFPVRGFGFLDGGR